MKIGIYGGSFDPVHRGHVNAALTFQSEFDLDKVIVVPAYCSPFKKGLAVTPSEHRLNMCKIAFGDLPGFEVSELEIERADDGYMIDTIAQIREQYPGDELFLLLGTDQILSFRKWFAWSKIADEVTIVGTARNYDSDSEVEAEAAVLRSYGAEVVIMPIDVMEISSTEVRQATRNADDISAMVPEGVAEYIWNNYLYYD